MPLSKREQLFIDELRGFVESLEEAVADVRRQQTEQESRRPVLTVVHDGEEAS